MGTTVCVELPVIAPPPAVDEAPAPEPPAVTPARTVLLVEDDCDSAEMLSMLLSLEGFEVQTVGSLHAATGMAGCCDVLVSDIALPDGSGLDLMRRIRATGNSMRGIALSGYGSAQDIQRSLDAGFEEHLTKPVDLGQLVEAVRRLTTPKV